MPAGLSLRRVADLRVSAVRVYLSSDTFWVCVPENRFHPPLLSGSPTSALFFFRGLKMFSVPLWTRVLRA